MKESKKEKVLLISLFPLLAIVVLVIYAVVNSVLAAPTFVTGRMMDRRNGLTDAQYEYLWSIGRNPQIKQTVARDWMFRASRYQNVTNWLDICGASNDFAKLSYDLQGKNFDLDATNKVLVVTNGVLEAKCIRLSDALADMYVSLTNEMSKCSSLSNMLVIVSAQATAAQAKIEDEIADLQAKITKYEEYKTKYKALTLIWNALITDAENRIKILQALTGGAQ